MDLVFTKNENPETFTNPATAQFDNLNEHALWRELIQNSLDATSDSGRVNIEISLQNISKKDLPGLDDLQQALDLAVNYNSDDTQTEAISTSINKALTKDSFNVLIFRDDGVGLDTRGMNSILHEGMSAKPDALGSYGNGHLSTFKFSNLMYVLYVGVSEDDGVLISGHTILASHYKDEILYGKDGFLAKEKLPDRYDGFKFHSEDEINSQFISSIVADIKSNNGTGSAIIIVDFNATENLAKLINIASLHFFPSILDENLSISFTNLDEEVIDIDAQKLESIFENLKDQKRSIGLSKGPRGCDTYEAFLTYKSENKITIQTSMLGDIDCFLRSDNVSKTNITLFRKGMWISQNVKELNPPKFKLFEPFDLVLNINNNQNTELHNLVRDCEGSLHLHLSKRAAYEDKWDKLCLFWQEFRGQLEPHLIEESFDNFILDEHAMIDIHNPNDTGVVPISRWKKKKRDKPDKPNPEPVDRDDNYFNPLGPVAPVSGKLRRLDDGQTLIAVVMPEKSMSLLELRVAELRGSDASCLASGDTRLNDQIFCEIQSLEINDKPFNYLDAKVGIKKKPTNEDADVGIYAIRIPTIEKNEALKIKAKFMPTLGDPNAQVKLDFVDRSDLGEV